MPGTVLVVDDDADAAEMVCEMLRARGFRATPEHQPEEAAKDISGGGYEAIVTDLQMGAFDGLELCRQVAAVRPDVPVVVMTGHASVEAAVGALRAGAFDFATKPVDPDILSLTLERAIEHHRMQNELHRLRSEVKEARGFDRLLGTSPAMRRVAETIRRVSPTQATVLITGQSGTGKELVARAIHESSPRAKGPFVAINCAAVPATLLESELFGHAKGAFTDAKNTRKGLFLEAQGGTLFLDEIGEMPLEMQVKLLRALQERTVRAVGGSSETPFDARVVAATNRDLEAEVNERRFREDLYYRINVCSVEVPPLKDREGDVGVLARAFVERFAKKHGKAVRGVAGPALEKLVAYDWPGNVRELENSIERAVAMAQFDQLVIDDLPLRVRQHRPSEDESSFLPREVGDLVTVDELERRYLHHVLKLVKGNKSKAARVLGYDRRTLYRKLERDSQALKNDEAQEEAMRAASVSTTGNTGRTTGPISAAPVHTARPSGALPPRPMEASTTTRSGSHDLLAVRESSPSIPVAAVDVAGGSVLVVDDDDDSRELLGILLEGRGFSVEMAASIEEAKERSDVDLIVTDLQLPDGTGDELIGFFSPKPVIALTGRLTGERDQRFSAYLAKPIAIDRLVSEMAKALRTPQSSLRA